MAGSPTTQDVVRLAAAADAVGVRIGRHFARSEPRRRAGEYVRGLLGNSRRRDGWRVAQAHHGGMPLATAASGRTVTPAAGTPPAGRLTSFRPAALGPAGRPAGRSG